MKLSPKIAVLLILGCLCIASPSMAGGGPFRYDIDPREVPAMGDPDSGTGGAGQQAPHGTIVQTHAHDGDLPRAAILKVMMSLMKMRMIAR